MASLICGDMCPFSTSSIVMYSPNPSCCPPIREASRVEAKDGCTSLTLGKPPKHVGGSPKHVGEVAFIVPPASKAQGKRWLAVPHNLQ